MIWKANQRLGQNFQTTLHLNYLVKKRLIEFLLWPVIYNIQDLAIRVLLRLEFQVAHLILNVTLATDQK